MAKPLNASSMLTVYHQRLLNNNLLPHIVALAGYFFFASKKFNPCGYLNIKLKVMGCTITQIEQALISEKQEQIDSVKYELESPMPVWVRLEFQGELKKLEEELAELEEAQ
jgi:hypothetical protein